MKTLCLFASLFCSIARADSLDLSFGPSVDGQIGDKKMLTLDYELQWAGPSIEIMAGSFNEPADNSFTGFGALNLGVHVVSEDGLSVRMGVGPTYITQTDDRLSSNFEFNIQARIGLEMKSWQAGFQFMHFSNAGIVKPNLGMDVCSVYLGFPL